MTLRQWQKDPLTSLDHLPQLVEEDFSPGTWTRLLSHVNAAITHVMNDWQEALSRTVGTARSDHELGRDLVQLRRVLARRVQLAGHVSLPPRVRDALSADTKASILRLQADLEKNVAGSAADGKVDPAAADRLLGIVRTNSLVHVLTLETSQDGSAAAPAALMAPPSPLGTEAGSEPAPALQGPAGVGKRRQVQFFDTNIKLDS
jgi:hypothetical protein